MCCCLWFDAYVKLSQFGMSSGIVSQVQALYRSQIHVHAPGNGQRMLSQMRVVEKGLSLRNAPQ